MAISEKYTKHRWKFLTLGAVSGLLMSVASDTTNPAQLLGDFVGGALLWLIIWWFWAKSKSRAEAKDATQEHSAK
jgi:glycerol uptake facilitator-like aquaporin